ncbi:hypothetical protein DFR58_111128 [Anaerobacterium chartisolvens]|uniref:Uncharacterized protein n=1 Tax=Anaerobacterium chartisolvens TaxID=1297424 RepID=A0A369B4C8_9FIRM|nr:Na+-transporting methylmalonyl-CoA/oxaloacetate decarboxylase subunit beta [Anaerobacterium chartisolvens]RCX16379.1 hypothetical protein DFR58_111128 [Anaerobacterium chartisolvens]
MKVHYDSSLWDKKNGIGGTAESTDWQFEHLGLTRHIPCIYKFANGIVFDLLTILDEDRLRAYYKKYSDMEERLSPVEKRCAAQEHPFRDINIKEIWIDGYRAEEGYSSSSCAYIPFAGDGSELGEIREAYRSALNGAACFSCSRFKIPYPKAPSILHKLLRMLRLGKVHNLKLITHEQRRFYPIELSFTLSEEEGEKSISFVHPATGITHTLYLRLGKPFELPKDAPIRQSFHCMEASYEIQPPLVQNDRLKFDSSISYTHALEENPSPEACSIGIIGGADGPTSIFVAGKGQIPLGPHGLPLNTCFSVITSEKSQAARFVLQGLDSKTGESEEIVLQRQAPFRST